MTPNGRAQTGWRLALGGLALALATNGCSALIAHSGVSSVSEIDRPQTRAEVRDAFGEADETGTCPDGRPVERRAIRRNLPDYPCSFDLRARQLCYHPGFLLVEPLMFPVAVAASYRAKLHYTFVYDADDRVLWRYDRAVSPVERFDVAVDQLPDALSRRLTDGGCPSWEACLTSYAEEVRRRAACVEFSLYPEQEAMLHDLIMVAAYVDAGRLSKDIALARIERCASVKSYMSSCVPPTPGE